MIENYIDFFIAFENDFENLKLSYSDIINQATALIQFIERKIKELFNWLKLHVFESADTEIYFFKELKPKLISKLIFYKEVLKLESNMPSPKKLKMRHYEKALDKTFQNSKKFREFKQYYRSKSTCNDAVYFVRNKNKSIICDVTFEVNFDFDICSSHDHKLALIMSNDLFSDYVENKIEAINNSCNLHHPSLQSNLNWTGTKIELVELIYALNQQKVFNGGNTDIKEIAAVVGKMFNIDIEESIYRSYTDIKNRKTGHTKFLNSLSESLNNKIIAEED